MNNIQKARLKRVAYQTYAFLRNSENFTKFNDAEGNFDIVSFFDQLSYLLLVKLGKPVFDQLLNNILGLNESLLLESLILGYSARNLQDVERMFLKYDCKDNYFLNELKSNFLRK